jgi:hypothetical protein
MTVPRRRPKSGNSPSALNLVAQKSAKKKAKKSAKRASGASVLGSLPSSRPSRIGGERRGTTTPKPPATETKPPAAKPAKPKPAKAAKPKPGKAKVKPTKRVVPGPEPARTPHAPEGRPSGTEIVTTAVQAAGELAQIGATVGRQLLKRATRRIPRP